MKKTLFIILIFLIALNCGKRNNPKKERTAKIDAVVVKAAPVTETIIAEQIKITGEIAPIYRVQVFPRANGIVVSESVSPGDVVRKDQVLAEVKQDIPGMEFSNVRIEATNSGVITQDLVDIGTRVSIQQPVYAISRLNPIYMTGKIPETYLSQVKAGAAVSVKVDAYPHENFPGKISEIEPIIDRMSRMAGLKITIDNPQLKLKPGMFACCYVKLGSHSGLIVPLDAIVHTGANRYVYRIEDGRAKEIRIQTGIISNEAIEIVGDLKRGDLVVVLGQNMLEDGSPVRVKND